MLFLVYFAEDSGDLKTSHFAIMTGLMALGMMIPGMFSGTLQTMMGYRNFFLWVMIATIPGFIATYLAKRVVRPDFGAKRQEALEWIRKIYDLFYLGYIFLSGVFMLWSDFKIKYAVDRFGEQRLNR